MDQEWTEDMQMIRSEFNTIAWSELNELDLSEYKHLIWSEFIKITYGPSLR